VEFDVLVSFKRRRLRCCSLYKGKEIRGMKQGVSRQEKRKKEE